ncbi:hypothetical protein E4U54_008316 [Claviceps lovelessii]|nr:hypothetical protein E4U54_008316 [Claviceps lovelessii]
MLSFWSSTFSSVQSRGYFTLSLLGTILGPAFVSIALFVWFPHVLNVYGERPSLVQPILAELILCILMAAAVGIDVIGVVFVSYEFNGVTRDRSASIIAAGLGIQITSLLFSVAVYLSFALCPRPDQGDAGGNDRAVYCTAQFKRFLRGAEISTSLILLHSIYRIVEVAGGLDSTLFQNEAVFLVMNGALPLLSALLLTVLHPKTAFGTAWKTTREPSPAHTALALPIELRDYHWYMPAAYQ